MQNTLIFLPFGSYVLLVLLLYRQKGGNDISEALVKGHIVVFSFIAISTELLSLFQEISFLALLVVWLVFFAVSLLLLYKYGRNKLFSFTFLKEKSLFVYAFGGAIFFILLTTFVTALLYPPNNWDSMTYHMARLVHWMSSKDVAFYPTAITRQNFQMPLAEFAIMHIQILTGGDLFANLIQWVSFVVLMSLAMLTAAELGLEKRQQFISAVILSTTPMAVLQASSTQNDLVVSSFIMSFALFLLRMANNFNSENILFAALGLGLALLTKGTAYIYCIATGIFIVPCIIINSGRDKKKLLKSFGAFSFILVIALSLNAGHFSRNYRLYGHPLSTEGKRYENEEMSVSAFISNVARNSALHLGIPSLTVNTYLYKVLEFILGPQLNNKKTSWSGKAFDIPYTLHEDDAGNLIHMAGIAFCFILMPLLWFKSRYLNTRGYFFSVFGGFLLYCYLLKWQPWASRLHTPFFLMAAPLLSLCFTSGVYLRKSIGYAIVLLMIIYSLPFALANSSRSLLSLDWFHNTREQLYFQNRKNLYNDYLWAINVLKKNDSREAGLYIDGDDWEYPFWALSDNEILFRHMGVKNISAKAGSNDFMPNYVITTRSTDQWEQKKAYQLLSRQGSVGIFEKLNDAVKK